VTRTKPPPTPAALKVVREALSSPPSYTRLGDGGMTVRWTKDYRSVTLIVPPTGPEQACLYRRTRGGDSDLSYEISRNRLADWLDWQDKKTPALSGA